MKYLYKCFNLNPVTGEVIELFENSVNPKTTLKTLGENGWEVVGSEYVGTKEACGGKLKSASIWIAKKEVKEDV